MRRLLPFAAPLAVAALLAAGCSDDDPNSADDAPIVVTTSILGAIVGIGGVYMLYALDGIGRRR